MALPRYEVLQRTFIEPILLEKGSVIDYAGSPGPHLYPLNEEAVAKMEAWYGEEYPQKDAEGQDIFYLDDAGSKRQKMYKPHEVFRRRDYQPVEAARFELVAAPPEPKPGEVQHTLAGLGLKTSTADPRPGPDRIYRDAPVMLPEGGVMEPATEEGVEGLAVVKAKTIPKREMLATLRGEEPPPPARPV